MTDLQQIISDLEQQKAAIESALASLRGLSTGAPRRGAGRTAGTRGPGRPPKKGATISEEGRRRIANAQRERWAAAKKTAKTVGSTGPAGRKRSASKKAAAKK